MHFFFIFLIAISLSMDAFSLSLAYGTLSFSKKEKQTLTLIVGLFHFFMPLLGHFLGDLLFSFFPIKPNYIICISLVMIGIQMIFDQKKEEIKKLSIFEQLIFGFAVSIDSFSIGIGLISLTKHVFLSSILFCICSAFFTYLGLCLGEKAYERLGRVSVFIGGIVLIIIGALSFF